MISAIVVLLINVVSCTIAVSKYKVQGNLAILYEGDCDKVKRLDLWLHLVINILSTMLLAASHYSMQCVSAPTRTDIDRAHRKNSWMDVGIPSVRNLRFISWPRKILFCCLILSSVPLHLMYNSVVYSSTSLSGTGLFVVTDDFLAGAPYDLSTPGLIGDLSTSYSESNIITRLDRLRDTTSSVRLEIPECQKAYGSTPLISTWSDALAVTTTASTNNSLLGANLGYGQSQLMCTDHSSGDFYDGFNSTCLESSIKFQTNSGGKQQAYMASYCLGLEAHQHCKVGFTVELLIGVIVCNLIKIVCIGYTVFRLDSRPLVTLGDALASFLDSPGQSFPPIPSGLSILSV